MQFYKLYILCLLDCYFFIIFTFLCITASLVLYYYLLCYYNYYCIVAVGVLFIFLLFLYLFIYLFDVFLCLFHTNLC